MKTKTAKRMLATLLTLVLILGALPFTAPLTVQAAPIPTPNGTITAPGIVGNGNILRVYGPTTITGDITVNSGGVLILDTNRTISGTVTVHADGRFYMTNGTITGAGRGVLVTGANARFYMSGGEIRGNTMVGGGGGVSATSNALFEMSGGTIAGNTATRGGGVNVTARGTFIMTGGIIGGLNPGDANTATTATEAGGGVAVTDSRFYMQAGNGTVPQIVGNIANGAGGGVLIDHNFNAYTDTGLRSVFTMEAGIIYGNRAYVPTFEGGGGVRVISAGSFIMQGGIIENNTASHGGGVSLAQLANPANALPTFTMHGGQIINNNGTGSGGGIRAGVNSTTNIHGGTISGNTAQANGGGAFVHGADVVFNVHAGNITNNTATTGFGGGIWTANYGSLDISNAVTFRGNSASATGRFDHGADNRTAPRPHSVSNANAGGGDGGFIDRINWGRVSLWGSHALNNYDINYFGEEWEPPTYLTPEIDIEKTFRLPTGSLLPTPPSRTTINFEFEVNLVEVNGFSPPQFRLPGQPAGAYQHLIFEPEISFNPGTTLSTGNGYVYVTGTRIVCFANITWPFPGMFVFEVRELSNTSGLSGIGTMVYDPATFRIYVHTRWLDDEQQHVGVWYYYARVPFVNCAACETPANGNNGNNGGNGTTPAPCTCTRCATGDFCPACRRRVKGNEVPFNNRFAPNGSLVVEKAVTGTSQLNTEFEFGMVLTLPPLMAGHHPTSITAYIYGYTRQNGQPVEDQPKVRVGNAITATVTNGVATLPTFHLRHGDEIRFASLPIGTTYVVTEANQDRYTQTARVTIAGTTGTVIEQIGTAALTIPGSVAQRMYNEAIDSASNRVVVTNDRVHAPPMAAMFNDTPFGLMLAIGAGALGLVGTVAIAYKKKKR